MSVLHVVALSNCSCNNAAPGGAATYGCGTAFRFGFQPGETNMQGPWSYDDSMGGNTVIASDEAQRCEACGGRTVHTEDCDPRPE